MKLGLLLLSAALVVCVIACRKDPTQETGYQQLKEFGQKLIDECRDTFNGYPLRKLAPYRGRNGEEIFYETLQECQPARPVGKVEK